jgi:hypothetical protein
MHDTEIIKPDITPEERQKRLNEAAAALTRVTGLKCEYMKNNKESPKVSKGKRAILSRNVLKHP